MVFYYFDDNYLESKNKKEPKVARIELKNVKSSSYASESSTKLNTDKSKLFKRFLSFS